jgi:CheY-like chemotaxis protein
LLCADLSLDMLKFGNENTARQASVVLQYHDFSEFPRFALIGIFLILLILVIMPSGQSSLWIVLTKEMVQLSKNDADADDYSSTVYLRVVQTKEMVQLSKNDADADDYSPSAYPKSSYGQTTIPRCYSVYLQIDASIKNNKRKITSLYNKRILIVDDDAYITFALRKALIDNGFKQVDTFNDPLKALESFKPGQYDLVILDIIMPQMVGFKVYEKMKEIDNKVKVCFITAYDVNYQALRAVFPTVNNTGELECFIRKPVEVQKLVEQVKGEL